MVVIERTGEWLAEGTRRDQSGIRKLLLAQVEDKKTRENTKRNTSYTVRCSNVHRYRYIHSSHLVNKLDGTVAQDSVDVC